MTIEVIQGSYAVCKLKQIPQVQKAATLFFLTVTNSEISLVCEDELIPHDCKAEKGFSAMRIAGILDFSLNGILAKISGILEQEGVSIFAISTYDTDYILVKDHDLERAIETLTQSGHQIHTIN